MKRITDARQLAAAPNPAHTSTPPLPRVTPVAPAGGRLTPAVSGQTAAQCVVSLGGPGGISTSGARLTAGASVGGASRMVRFREVFTGRTFSSLAGFRLPTADASGVVFAIRGGHDAAVGRQHHRSTGTASSHE